MTLALKIALLVLVLTTPVAVGYVYYNGALSPDNWVYEGNGQWRDGGVHAAPGPEMGAGLPILIIAGAGYLAARRFRRKTA